MLIGIFLNWSSELHHTQKKTTQTAWALQQLHHSCYCSERYCESLLALWPKTYWLFLFAGHECCLDYPFLSNFFLVNIKASYIFSFHSVQIELPGHLGIMWEWVWPFNHPFPVISLLMSQSGLSHCYHRNLTTAISLILLFLIPSPGPNLQRLAETIIIPPKRVFLSRASSETWSMLDEPTWDLYIWLAKLQIFLFLWISSYNASIVIGFDFQPQ